MDQVLRLHKISSDRHDHDDDDDDADRCIYKKQLLLYRRSIGNSITTPNTIAPLFLVIITLLPSRILVSADVSINPNRNLIDLSWPYNEKTLGWIEFRNFSMDIVFDGERKSDDGTSMWVRAENIAMAIHSGTHMDAPLHFCKDKWSVDEIPIEHFVDRPLVVINAERSVIKNREYQITEADILAWEEENGRIPEGSVIFFRTGFSKFYSDRSKYFGTNGAAIVKKNMRFPGLHPEAAEWIVRNRLVVGIGIDALSIDAARTKPVCHQIILERNMYILENLNSNIDQIPLTGAKVHILPVKIEGSSGAPARVIVDINASSTSQPFFILIVLCISLYLCNAA